MMSRKEKEEFNWLVDAVAIMSHEIVALQKAVKLLGGNHEF